MSALKCCRAQLSRTQKSALNSRRSSVLRSKVGAQKLPRSNVARAKVGAQVSCAQKSALNCPRSIDLFHIGIDVLGLVMSSMILPGVYCKQVEQPLQLAGVRCGVGVCGAKLLRAPLKSLNFSPFSLIGA